MDQSKGNKFKYKKVNFELGQVKGVDVKLIDSIHTTLIKSGVKYFSIISMTNFFSLL